MKKMSCVFLLAVWAALAVYAQSGVIKELSGTVEIKPAGAADFTAAKVGDTVARDTIVSTGFKSTALVSVGSATILVRPLTRLSLTEIGQAQNTEDISVNLNAGRVRVDVTPPSGTRANFAVKSPTATASVRGTSFDLDTHNLYVSKGTVVYQGSGSAQARVSEGGASRIDSITGKPVSPVETHVVELLPPSPVAGPPTAAGTNQGPVAETGTAEISTGTGNVVGITITINP
jgi:hypothetical protein